jgi:hypothetical protein
MIIEQHHTDITRSGFNAKSTIAIKVMYTKISCDFHLS